MRFPRETYLFAWTVLVAVCVSCLEPKGTPQAWLIWGGSSLQGL
jgi:hypothetical protein